MEDYNSNRLWQLCLLVWATTSLADAAISARGVPKYILRKCCAADEYYNLDVQRCVKEGDLVAFEASVQSLMVKGNVRDMAIVTGRLLKCPDTGECFETNVISSDKTHTLLPNGLVFENFFGATYDLRNYCVESVGLSSQNTSLAIAFCLPETNVMPKCCPHNHYFEASTFECIEYPKNDRSEDLLSTFFYFKNELFLQYQYDLECASSFPVRFNLLSDAYIDECNNICLRSPKKCYSMRKYCLESAFTGRLEPSVYVCADNVTKVCCKDEYYENNEIECTCLPM